VSGPRASCGTRCRKRSRHHSVDVEHCAAFFRGATPEQAHAVNDPPDGSDAGRARAFDALLDGRRIREDLGFKPKFPRLGDAIDAGA